MLAFLAAAVLCLAAGATSASASGAAIDGTVTASGPSPTTALEDHVEVTWTTDAPIASTSMFKLTRDGTLVHVAASTETLYQDFGGVPGTTYEYCVYVDDETDPDAEIACDDGARVIKPPSGFVAADGLNEQHVPLTWSDVSAIEGGYNLYRDAGRALRLDGVDDYVSTAGIIDVPGSFTFEFWARRNSINTADFVINLETAPNGDPVDVDVEVGFDSNNRFVFGFGTNRLVAGPYTDTDWQHWAVVYDASSQRRYIYRNGEQVATDIRALPSAPTGNLEFGRQTPLGPTSSRGHFHGDIDEIRYWSAALSAARVAEVKDALLFGNEADLASFWPMDRLGGTSVADVRGTRLGTVIANANPTWPVTGASLRYLLLPANTTSYFDRTAVAGYEQYGYEIAAFEDANGNGVFDEGPNYESVRRDDEGWRATVTPPANVAASDGQFTDRVRITWVDQSASETGYRVFYQGNLIGTTPADATQFDHVVNSADGEYCVAALSGGTESVRICDFGRVGGLTPPANVLASVNTFDDRVQITWTDQSTTESGFEVLRNGVLLATTGENAKEYNDFSAEQEVAYPYCVRAISTADPLNPSRSDPVCAPDNGVRAAVLAPENMTASDAEHEDRVALRWQSSSTTAMLFQVYRDGTLIEVLDRNILMATDKAIESDLDYEYCVSAATVIATTSSSSIQGKVVQAFQQIQIEDAAREASGAATASAQSKMMVIYEALGVAPGASAATLEAAGFRESDPVCDVGSRSINPPTDVVATDNEHESHVQIEWADNSSVEKGYKLFRTGGGTTDSLIATLSPNRTTYGDYTGASGVVYEYKLVAFDSRDSSSADFDEGHRILKPPTGFRASKGTSETLVNLSWKDNSSAEVGYRVYRRTGANDFLEVGVTGKNEPGLVDVIPDDELGARFDYRVVAFDDFGESIPVEDEGYTFLKEPADLNASDSYQGHVVIVWVDRSEIEDEYSLTRRQVGKQNLDWTETLAANATTYTDDNVSAGVRYEYCVRSGVDSNGSMLYSDPICETGGTPSGAGGGTTDPTLTAKKITQPHFVFPDAWDGGVRIGASVALSGGNALIGAPGGNDDDGGLGFGSVISESRTGWVARYSYNENNEWQHQEYWGASPGGNSQEEYGHAVDISGDYAVVGDPFKPDDEHGAFEIWQFDSEWSAAIFGDQTFSSEDDNTGYAVAIVDSFVIVGNYLYEENLPDGHGSAIVCNVQAALRADESCTRADNVVMLEEQLSSSQQRPNAQFGYAVDITRAADTLYALVGAPGNDVAFIFSCDLSTSECGETSDWETQVRLPSRFRPGDRFGAAVGISPDIAVATAPNGKALILYTQELGEWEEQSPYRAPSSADEFGVAVAVDGTHLIVGAPGEDVGDHEDAGTVYTMEWDVNQEQLTPPVRYDARVAGAVLANARFGASVDVATDVGDGFYLVGAPFDRDLFGMPVGTAYSIPIGSPSPSGLIVPSNVSLDVPGNIRASDGTAPDRIQVRWDDESDNEEGHFIYRSNDFGEIELLTEVGPNVTFFDDFEAAPGEAYNYCVTAYYKDQETDRACDGGWRPPNGTIAGRLAAREGGGTENALVCLDPSPNKALLFDGVGGFVRAPAGEELDLFDNFTVEAWILPHATDGLRFVVSKDSAYALAINEGRVHFTLFSSTEGDRTFEASTLPAMTAGNWYHIAVSMSDDWEITLYQDGVAEDGGDAGGSGSTIGEFLFIGQKGDSTGYFKGLIDEVRIWEVELDEASIADARFDVLSGKEENLIGYWGLDQGARLVVPDLTSSANHGSLFDGVYLAREGAPLDFCATTTAEGNFSIPRIRYGATTEFNVTPSRPDRVFEPTFKKITLTIESPVQNEVGFTDVTAFTVAGTVSYTDFVTYPELSRTDTLSCPVADVQIHTTKGDPATDQNVRTTTGADGSYAVALDPSKDNADTWHIIPRLEAGGTTHAFTPSTRELILTADVFDADFSSEQRHTLSGHFSGGDPGTCGKNIGVATIRIYTQDGCYDRLITVNSAENAGYFELDLPPLQYLMEVVEVDGASEDREEEVQEFFAQLGTVEVDLRQGNEERNMIYRAPIVFELSLEKSGETNSCDVLTQIDNEGNPVRELPVVPIIGEFEGRAVEILVREDYGDGEFCLVDEGTITIYDGIANMADADSTMELQNGTVDYTTFGISPNIFSGARIGGVDRSFQKPFTAVAQVEGRESLMETRWAIVEGARERASTFVSATTEEFPLLIVHDPPGGGSYAFLEEGTTYCTNWSNMKLFGGGGGVDIDLRFGFDSYVFIAPMGFGYAIENGGGFSIGGRIVAGRDVTTPWEAGGPNREVCLTTTKTVTTSDDPGWVGEDIHVGVALNLIFAIADVLEADQCEIQLSETLAADLDEAEPFQTTYAYGSHHINETLIPELENLARLAGGDATVEGTINGTNTKIRLQNAIENWRKQIVNSAALQEEALANPIINRSFSGGTEFSFSEAVDSTEVTSFESTRIYLDAEGHAGGLLTLLGHEQEILAVFEVRSEWVSEKETNEEHSKSIGYVLKDEDAGDYFSVDIAKNPRYGTYVFGTVSGRSSNTCEEDTQCRDNPIIAVDPPVLHNIPHGSPATFDVTLINGSESNERRRYVLASPAETNPNGLTMHVSGGVLSGPREYLLDPGKALTVRMDTYASPSAFSYRRVGVMLYPPDEYPIWAGEMRLPFALSDTAFFSVFFDSTGGKVLSSMLAEGWNWISINREGGELASVLEDVPVSHGDIIRGQRSEARYDSTEGWQGSLTKLVPGEGYRLRIQRPAMFRLLGDPIENARLELTPGWSWIGYLPSKRLPLDIALASLDNRVMEGDLVVGQRAFAQYVRGVGWVGTLRDMVPGESYALYLDGGGVLSNANIPDEVPPRAPEAWESTINGPAWELEAAQFDASMTVVADLQMNGVPIEHTALKVAAFAGESIRGLGEVRYVEALKRHLTFIQLYGDVDGEEKLVVHVYDGEADALYEDVASINYTAQGRIGNPSAPVTIDMASSGQAPLLQDLPREIALHPNYPNPFNGYTTIGYDLPEATRVRLTVYDLLGRRVALLVDGEQSAGRHKAVFDARGYASGVYLYRMEIGGARHDGKMVLVK